MNVLSLHHQTTTNNLKHTAMKTYKIEAMTIKANNKKEAVKQYVDQHRLTFMCECEKSFSVLYRLAKEVKTAYKVN